MLNPIAIVLEIEDSGSSLILNKTFVSQLSPSQQGIAFVLQTGH
jgi:hypothetical protein